METKSPSTSVKSREIIGEDLFSQRREVFDKHDTVFLPLPSPTNMVPAYEVEPIITSNHGKTTTNFKRNTPGYSSMRETKTEGLNSIDFRPRKYSDNFTSELNQSDDVDYRYSMTERTRRLSKLRREFLASNLHEPSNENPFARTGTRASMPARSGSIKYKIESPNLYKFPFAEPFATPPPVRRVVLDLGPVELDDAKENQDPAIKQPKHQSLPNNENTTKVDHQKLFEELVKRYSPQRKPIDWTLPPTRPKVVGSVPKSTSSATENISLSENQKGSEDKLNKSGEDDVFVDLKASADSKPKHEEEVKTNTEIVQNGPETTNEETVKNDDNKKERDSKISLTELAETKDEVPELALIQRQLSKGSIKKPLEKITDLSIPALLEKMAAGEDLETNKKDAKKVKRKRSFLDKLLGRKKEK